jgi:hypothetical protein
VRTEYVYLDGLPYPVMMDETTSPPDLAAELRAIADDLDGLAPLIANHAVKLDGVATILRERRDRIRAIAALLEE